MQQYECVSDSVPVCRPLCRSHTEAWCFSLSDIINLLHVCVCKNVRSGADSTRKNRTKWLHYERGCSLRPHHRNWCFNSFAFPKLLSMFPSLMWVCVSRCRLWLRLSVGVCFILQPYLYYCVCLCGFGDYSLICVCVSVFIYFPICVHVYMLRSASASPYSWLVMYHGTCCGAAWRQLDS